MNRRVKLMGLVLGAVSVVVISILGRILLRQIWRPYAIAKYFRKQGVIGPSYRFWSGSIEEIKRLKKAGSDLILANDCHDITKRVLAHYREWIPRYGQYYYYPSDFREQVVCDDSIQFNTFDGQGKHFCSGLDRNPRFV